MNAQRKSTLDNPARINGGVKKAKSCKITLKEAKERRGKERKVATQRTIFRRERGGSRGQRHDEE